MQKTENHSSKSAFADKMMTLSPWGFNHSVPTNSYLWLRFALIKAVMITLFSYKITYIIWFFDHYLLYFTHILLYIERWKLPLPFLQYSPSYHPANWSYLSLSVFAIWWIISEKPSESDSNKPCVIFSIKNICLYGAFTSSKYPCANL